MAQGDGGQVDWLEEAVSVIRRFHETVLQESGGVFGEHTASLYSAMARPFQSAFGELIYPTPVEQAAALLHAIICDHAFVDGNKRTGSLAALYMLAGHDAISDDPPNLSLRVRMLGEVALETASGNLTVGDVTRWLHRIFDP
jgi:death-on-curing protein